MKITFYILAAAVLLFSVIPLFKDEAWWIRIFDFPRLQVAVLSLTILVLMFILIKHWTAGPIIAVSAILIAIVIEIVQIFPYTQIAPKMTLDAEPGHREDATIKIMISNVRMKNREANKFNSRINEANPDLLLVMEPDDWWNGQLEHLDEKYPYSLKQPQENTYGMIAFSKLKMENTQINYLFKDDVPSMEFKLVLRNGRKIKIYALHPMPPQPGVDTEERDAELILAGKKAKQQDLPAIIAGDMNDVAWSHTTRLFMRTSQMMDPRRGRGFYNTYNANIPFFRWPLDHLFHTDDFRLVKMERLDEVGSDHFPVLIELVLQPEQNNGDAPQPEGDDHEEAEKKVRQAE